MNIHEGTQIGPYRILGRLGQGGSATVYLARDLRMGREVALKLLSSQHAQDASRLHDFHKELQAAGGLLHPNLVTVHDTGEWEGQPYLVMERLQGDTLRRQMEGRPMPWRKALPLVLQALEGLAAVHARGLVHRDLKPENIFINHESRIKLLDFGLATPGRPAPPGGECTTHSLEGGHGLVGSAAYMSPEQAGSGPVDARSDLFSLGIVLWEMLHGSRPFQGPSVIEVLHAILREDPPAPDPRLPPPLGRILLRCLAKAPASRFQSAQDLAFALREVLEAPPGAARCAGDPGAPRLSRRRAGRTLLATALLGLLASPALLLLRRPPAPPSYQHLETRPGRIQVARFSPDGGAIVYDARAPEGAWSVHVLGLDNQEERPVAFQEAKLLAVSRNAGLALGLDPRKAGGPGETFSYAFEGTLATSERLGATVPRPLSREVQWADFGPDGRLALIRREGGRSLLEWPAGVPRAESQGWFSHVRVSPDGRVACVEHPLAGDDRGRLLLIDRGRVLRPGPEWASLRGLAWKDGELWFTAGRSWRKALWALDPRSERQRLVLECPGDLLLQDISPTGSCLLIQEDLGARLLRVEAFQGRQRWSELGQGTWPELCSLGEGGLLLYEAQDRPGEGGYAIHLQGAADGAPMLLGEGEYSALSPDGQWVATLDHHPEPHIRLIRCAGGERRDLPAQGLRAFSALAWAGRDRLLVTGARQDEEQRLWLQELPSGALRPLGPGTIQPGSAAVSPDGRHCFAFSSQGPFLLDLDPEHPSPRPIRGLKPGEWVAGWCPDSRRLQVAQRLAQPLRLLELDPDTGRRGPARELETPGLRGLSLSQLQVGPGGRFAAFQGYRYRSEVYLAKGLR